MTKLNLGSGGKLIPGWDNLDINPLPGVLRCDLTKPLHYKPNTVTHIYSEHFLEHLDEVDGFNLLKQCYRVLKPGGHIRLCLPDLEQYVQMYLDWDKLSDTEKSRFPSGANYLNYAMLGEHWSGMKYLNEMKHSKNIGHKYYYDFSELNRKLHDIGFVSIKRCEHRQSEVPEFSGIERRAATKDLIVEAIK